MNRYPFHGRKLPKPPEEESLNPFLFKSKEEKERILSETPVLLGERVAPDVVPGEGAKSQNPHIQQVRWRVVILMLRRMIAALVDEGKSSIFSVFLFVINTHYPV